VKTLLLIFVLSILIQSCIDTEQQRQAEEYQNFIDGLYKHTEKCRLSYDSTNYYSKCYIDFDKYLSYFDELELDSNWVIEDVINKGADYLIYFVPRKKDDTSAKRIIEYAKNWENDINKEDPFLIDSDFIYYKNSDSIDNIYPFRVKSLKGYIQLIILHLIGNNYCLHWHSRYYVKDIITTNERLSLSFIIGYKNYTKSYLHSDFKPVLMPFSMRKKVLEIDPYPIIKEFKDSVNVELIIYNAWDGFLSYEYSVSKGFPHKVNFIEADTLVKYSCGPYF